MATTLTNRYISAVARRLPADLQRDVHDELGASIADDIEARVSAGEREADAETAVITALGDPDALAASYVDRPLHLIGPKYYLTWWKLLKLLWAIVPAVAVVGVVVAKLIENAPVPDLIATVFAVAIGAVVNVGFWTTVVFAVLERTGADTGGLTWTPDSLPEPGETGAGRGELISSLVLLGLVAGALLWDRFVGFVFVATGDIDIHEGLAGQAVAIPILHPALWPWWVGGLLVIIAAEAALAIAVYTRRGWSVGLAAVNTLLAVAVAVPAIWLLATGQLINPDLIEFALSGGDIPVDVPGIVAVITGVVIAGVAVWDSIDGWREVRRNR